MEYRKSLIGAASILALSVGSANASIAQQPSGEVQVPQARDLTSASFSDPLLELIVRTQGAFTEDAVRSALASMYADPAQTDIQQIPDLLNNLATLGLAPNVIEASKQTLVDIVSSAEADELLKADIVARLENGVGLVQLADGQEEILRRRGRRNPAEVGQIRDPSVVGQVGGGGY
jgi:hypothetical protein